MNTEKQMIYKILPEYIDLNGTLPEIIECLQSIVDRYSNAGIINMSVYGIDDGDYECKFGCHRLETDKELEDRLLEETCREIYQKTCELNQFETLCKKLGKKVVDVS